MQVAKLLFVSSICMISVVKAQSLPEGEAKQFVATTCSQCHALNYVTDTKRTLEQWQYIVSMMVSLGARVPEDKVETIVNYLAQNFGRAESMSTEPVTGEK